MAISEEHASALAELYRQRRKFNTNLEYFTPHSALDMVEKFFSGTGVYASIRSDLGGAGPLAAIFVKAVDEAYAIRLKGINQQIADLGGEV